LGIGDAENDHELLRCCEYAVAVEWGSTNLKQQADYVVDPEDDYTSLGALPNTVVLGGGRFLPEMNDLLMLLQQGLSVVLNSSHMDHQTKANYIHKHLPLVAKFRRERGYPHRILLDESHQVFGHPRRTRTRVCVFESR